jgi:multiple sugar transport system substrate-binding protein
MKKKSGVVLAVLMAALLFYGCDKKKAEEVLEPAELEFLQYWESGAAAGEFRGLIDQFEAENPGITVVLQSYPFRTARDRVMSSAAAGTLSDVVALSHTWVNSLWQQGALADLGAVMEEYGAGSAADVSGRFQVDGHTVMLPVADNVFGVAVNDDILARFGISKPATWDEFFEAAEKTNSPADGIAGFAVPLSVYSPEQIQQHILSWLWCGNGGSVVKDGRPDAVSPKHGETLAFFKRLYDARLLLANSFTEDARDGLGEFLNGRVAFLAVSNSDVRLLRGQNPALKFSIMPYPVNDSAVVRGATVYNNPWGIGISSRSAHPAQSWKLIQFLLRPDINSKLSAMTELFPANPEASVEPQPGPPSESSELDQDAMNEQLRALYDLYRNAKGFADEMSDLRVADNLMSIYVGEFQSYIFGRSGADEMMENVQRLWLENY